MRKSETAWPRSWVNTYVKAIYKKLCDVVLNINANIKRHTAHAIVSWTSNNYLIMKKDFSFTICEPSTNKLCGNSIISRKRYRKNRMDIIVSCHKTTPRIYTEWTCRGRMDKTMIYNSSDFLGYSQPDSKYLETLSFEFKALQWIIQGHGCKEQY